jgi:hypothetical protein
MLIEITDSLNNFFYRLYIFLITQSIRAKIKRYSKEDSILNLFNYTIFRL